MTLAIKEERRDAFSEAAANARLVLPQMPEIWGVDGGRPVPDVAPAASQVALLAPPPPNPRRQRTQPPLPASCAGLLARCERPFHVPQLAPTLLLPAAVMPAGRARAGRRRAAGFAPSLPPLFRSRTASSSMPPRDGSSRARSAAP